MKTRGLLCLLSISTLLIFAGCKKDNNTPKPTPPVTPPVKVSNTISIANLLQSNMVVQRNKPFLVWGKAPAATIVTVNASWNANGYTATTDENGNWKVTIPPAIANASPQTLTVKATGTNAVTLNNILIGDVWICSGQSNMVYQVDSIPPFRGVTDYPDVIAAANYPEIRALTMQADMQENPVDSLTYPAAWTVCSPQTVGNMSGVAYFFARKLYMSLNVPIGIIVSAVNGTSCETWINRETFNANTGIAAYSQVNNATMYYNGMINPLINLSITGFTWYQGENNKNNNPPSDYTKLNSALITGWRNVFNQGQLPFYFVQMTPFDQSYFSTNPPGGNPADDSYAKFREAQANVLAVPNTGMAITMDVGEVANQHPQNKQPVGERLALLALNKTYGQNVQCYGPQYASYTTSGNSATINFVPGTANGLNTIGNLPMKQYFFVAGTNHQFVQATAVINGSQILITAPANVPLPIQAVRYAFTVAPITNLQNDAPLPMEPFRTDNWSN